MTQLFTWHQRRWASIHYYLNPFLSPPHYVHSSHFPAHFFLLRTSPKEPLSRKGDLHKYYWGDNQEKLQRDGMREYPFEIQQSWFDIQQSASSTSAHVGNCRMRRETDLTNLALNHKYFNYSSSSNDTSHPLSTVQRIEYIYDANGLHFFCFFF